MKLAAIIVTYRPDLHEVEQNVATFAENVDMLMVWDNSETPADFHHLEQLYPNIILHQEGRNIGLAEAYNKAISTARDNGCSHLMTMDQDSTFENFKEYRHQLEAFTDSTVGIFTCPINNDTDKPGYRDTAVCQSGSTYTMEMLHQIGGFREDLFIGMVDAEMSLRALEKGYRIYQIANCNLIQHVGSGRKARLLGKEISVSDYSPLRHYYDSRNRILLWYEFPYDFSPWHKLHFLWSRLKLMIKIILFENNKLPKTKAILLGTWYGFRNLPKPYSKK